MEDELLNDLRSEGSEPGVQTEPQGAAGQPCESESAEISKEQWASLQTQGQAPADQPCEPAWLRFLILSRGRARSMVSHKLFPFADIIVPESEQDDYEKRLRRPVLVYPDEIRGLSVLRNWILDNFSNHVIVMIDDDIHRVYNQEFNLYTAITRPEDLRRLLESTARITLDLQKSLFGYKASQNIIFYDPTKPFRFTGWVGTVIGIVGREFRFDEHNILKVDADYSLQALLHDRIIVQDNRYMFVSIKIKNQGGNSTYRTRDRVEREKLYLKKKWGKHISFTHKVDGESVKLNVKRTAIRK